MEYYGTKEVSKILGYTQTYVTKLCRDGKFPNAEQDAPGSPWRIPKTDVEKITKNTNSKEN